MARQKTNKTAVKRFKLSNPKGNRKPKIKYRKTAQHHLKTKRSARVKRRKPSNSVVDKTMVKNIVRKVINLR